MTAFGRSALDHWLLDPAYAYLNHGTVGATPRLVLERQRAWQDRIERHPAELMLRRLSNPFATDWSGEPPLMRQAAEAVAGFVGADPDGLALVDNITSGANAVLRSLDLGPGDTVAITNLGYGGVTNAVRYAVERAGASLYVIDLPAPGPGPDVFADEFARQLRPGTRLAVVDHLAAYAAVVLPVDRFVAACRANDTMVLVDGAHVPGQIDLDVGALADAGADFYTANLHKWAWTPRSSGFLWVAERHRQDLHPTVISWGLGRGLAAEFDLVGTRDPTPFLVIPEVLAYRAEFGEDKIRSYIHQTCWDGARFLADRWGTRFDSPEQMIGAMAVIRLPGRLGSTVDDAEALRRFLDVEHRIEVPIFALTGNGGAALEASSWRDLTTAQPDPHGLGEKPGMVVRICTQIYNDGSDVERLADAVMAAPHDTRGNDQAGDRRPGSGQGSPVQST